MQPQEVITIFRELKLKNEEKQWIGYPELEEFFQKGYFIEYFTQIPIGNERFMITFLFKKHTDRQY
ncbi:MAG TPA: hypothetical protein VD905_02760 [Flavobacteriales bacterium]|nr:hypothetical protein [Flavobacteriales bacterium]